MNKYTCKNKDALYFKKVKLSPNPFFEDTDEILYSLAFLRYLDKTQVFSFKDNDHLTKRMTHVLYVSKIARTIGRSLGLNEDLIEAASLGHDLGHTPFGHVGETILNEISLKNKEGYFNHNIQSVRILTTLEDHGKGKNITLQCLDAIMCHNGEIAKEKYTYKSKTKEKFKEEYLASYQDESVNKSLVPMTLEGCVVRISDLISYLGRDIEDAMRMNLVTFDDIPDIVKKVLGTSNEEIVKTIMDDCIKNSLGKNYISLSSDVYDAVETLKAFNYENIYYKAYTKKEKENIKKLFNDLFNRCLEDVKNNNQNSTIISSYLNNMSKKYQKENTPERIVLDYIAGMTDDYALKEYNKIINKSHTKGEVEK